MKCHYEVLAVSRDADDNEIKTAYRKLALRWHPDKNLDNPEEAKDQFQLVQQAYEVLSDLHERAWYDNHREQILRGGRSDYEENCLDLFQYFTVSCFKGYGDDENGFYQIYAEVFEKITAEDVEFMEDDAEIENIPKFGNSQSSYEEVVAPFYAYWQSYCTKKSYAWLCPYNISEIRDRRLLREIEKEHKKVVQKAKRERNEEVRNLVSFIRKRDKRVQSYKKLLEERAAANRQKQEQIRLEQLRKRKQQIEELQKETNPLNDAYEEQLKQLAQEYDDSEDDSCSESDGEGQEDEEQDDANLNDLSYIDSCYCIACNKQFRNENAFLNHQSSKKHKLNVELIKDSFREELEEFELKIDGTSPSPKLSDTEVEIQIPQPKSRKHEMLKKDVPILTDEEIEMEHLASDSEEEPKVLKQKNKKGKKLKKVQAEPEENEDDLPELGELSLDQQADWEDDSKSKRKQKLKKGCQKKSTPAQPDSVNVTNSAASTAKVSGKPEGNSIPTQIDTAHTCVTCKATFESKNKLFTHLKKTNHGVYIPKKSFIAANSDLPEKTRKGKRNK